ncbi:unnamed protein product [Lepidochelys olivacea]
MARSGEEAEEKWRFFMLVFLIYATQLVAATLVPVHRKQHSGSPAHPHPRSSLRRSVYKLFRLRQHKSARSQIKSEFFPSELQRNYQGDTSSEVFSASWNTLVIVLARCSVLGPEDFGNSSRFHELHPASHGPAAPRTGLSWRPDSEGLEQEKVLERPELDAAKAGALVTVRLPGGRTPQPLWP